MGWCSATQIFDEVLEAAYRLQVTTEEITLNGGSTRSAIVDFAKVLRDVLEDGDWDCQQESDFYEDLKWDLWAERAQDHIDECIEYKDDYVDRNGTAWHWDDEDGWTYDS
jgi:hypothetical protein